MFINRSADHHNHDIGGGHNRWIGRGSKRTRRQDLRKDLGSLRFIEGHLSGIHQSNCCRIDIEGRGLDPFSSKGHRQRQPHMTTSTHDTEVDRRFEVPVHRLISRNVRIEPF